jgi:hypothetical protein
MKTARPLARSAAPAALAGRTRRGRLAAQGRRLRPRGFGEPDWCARAGRDELIDLCGLLALLRWAPPLIGLQRSPPQAVALPGAAADEARFLAGR